MPARASQAPGVSHHGPAPLLRPGLPNTAEAIKINKRRLRKSHGSEEPKETCPLHVTGDPDGLLGRKRQQGGIQ